MLAATAIMSSPSLFSFLAARQLFCMESELMVTSDIQVTHKRMQVLNHGAAGKHKKLNMESIE